MGDTERLSHVYIAFKDMYLWIKKLRDKKVLARGVGRIRGLGQIPKDKCFL